MFSKTTLVTFAGAGVAGITAPTVLGALGGLLPANTPAFVGVLIVAAYYTAVILLLHMMF